MNENSIIEVNQMWNTYLCKKGIMKLFSAILSTAILVLFVLACNGNKAEFTGEGPNYFGAKITDSGAQSLSAIDQGEIGSDSLSVVLKGEINEVCQAKGCWMTFESGNADESVFIRFRDYGFFVPKDAGGKEAVVKGKLFYNTTSVEELRHYAEDKGSSAEEIAAITEPKVELRMTADGVIIYN